VQVDGASIVAGSVYGCGTLPKRGTICYYGGADVDATVEYVKGRHAANLIDDPAFLANVPVHLFHGQLDEVITRPCMKDVRQQLRNFVPSRLIKVIFNTSATHVWSVDHGTCKCGACGWTGTPLCCDVNNCAYDLSGDILRHIYEPKQVIKPRTAAVEDNLFWVNQTAWIPAWTPDATFSPTGAAFMKWGLLYVPTNCYGAKLASCRVHVNYHGCTKKLYPRRKLWAHNLDLNEYGEANDIIFFYPQAAGNKTTTGVRVCLFATSAYDFALQFGCSFGSAHSGGVLELGLPERRQAVGHAPKRAAAHSREHCRQPRPRVCHSKELLGRAGHTRCGTHQRSHIVYTARLHFNAPQHNEAGSATRARRARAHMKYSGLAGACRLRRAWPPYGN